MKHCDLHLTTYFIYAVTSTLLIMSCEAKADEHTLEHNLLSLVEWQPVSEATLSSLRGGFVLSNGLVVDINVEKSIFQNGVLTSHSYFQSPQNINLDKGEFNFNSVLPDSTFNTVLQNTLDNQTLSTLKNIDVTIKHLEHAQLAFARDALYNNFFEARTHQ